MALSPPTLINTDVLDITDMIDPEAIIPRTRRFQPRLVTVTRAQFSQAQIYGVDPEVFRHNDTITIPVAGFAVQRGSIDRPDAHPYFVGFYVKVHDSNGNEVKIPLDHTGKPRIICTRSLVRETGRSVYLYCTIQDTPVVVWTVEDPTR